MCVAGECLSNRTNVSIRYWYDSANGQCDLALRVCALSTTDDGGLERWRRVYVDAGCTISDTPPGWTDPREVVFDCTARCRADAGNQQGYGCCVPGGNTPWCTSTACAWTPP